MAAREKQFSFSSWLRAVGFLLAARATFIIPALACGTVVQAGSSSLLGTAMTSLCARVLNGFDLHEVILSYVLDPLLMSTLCPVSKHWDGPCFHEGSWQGTMVDVPPWYKPLGLVAWNHFRSWKLAKLVVVRPWMFRYCGLLLDPSVRPWQWSTPRPILHPCKTMPRHKHRIPQR